MSLCLRSQGLVLALVLSAACDRAGPKRSNDTAVVVMPPPPTTPDSTIAIASPWDTAAGPAFLVVGSDPMQAAVVVPAFSADADLDTAHFDLDSALARSYDLFVAGHRAGSARLGSIISADPPDECTAWPQVRLRAAPDSQAAAWTVAIAQGRFTPLTVDSISGLSRTDSAQLVMELARVASSAPGDTVEALKGTAYVVRRGYRLTLPGYPSMVFAEIMRSLNQEANPAHEHMLLIMERDTLPRSRHRMTYVERSSGTEETLESTELLLAGTITGRTQPVILIARYAGDGVIYSLLERSDAQTWNVRWTSPYAGC